MTRNFPVVGIPADVRTLGHHPFHAVGEKYILAVSEAAGVMPLLIPSLGDGIDAEHLLDLFDGFLFTGSPSNVEPHHYAGAASRPGAWHDPARDATTLPLIRAAIARGIPVMAICRGHQELNVAFGGSLHQHVHEIASRHDHRSNDDDPIDVQYAPIHKVRLAPDGLLAEILGAGEIQVNSLHSQAIDRLAPNLIIEAEAEDGTIEAVRVAGAKAFALGVQWHPEWNIMANPAQQAILAAFGSAVRDYAHKRR